MNNSSRGSSSRQEKRELISDSMRLLIYLIATSYLFFVAATSRPHVGSWYAIAFLFLLPGICFGSFRIFHHLVYRKEMKRRWMVRILTIIIGLIFAVQLIKLESDLATDRYIQIYQPLVNALTAGKISVCKQPEEELDIKDAVRPKTSSDGLPGRTQWANHATIYFSGDHFVVSVPGSSVDIDGSRLYYESKGGGKWRLFHNDRGDEKERFSKRTENSMACRVSGS